MRNRIKAIVSFIMAICLSMVFVACDTDPGNTGAGGGGGGGGGGTSPIVEVYVLYEDGEFVKGIALELRSDGTCSLWDGGFRDDGDYVTDGNHITVTLYYADDETEVFAGVKSGDGINLAMYDEVWLFKKYTGNDWKGDGSGGSGGSGGTAYEAVRAVAVSEVGYSDYDQAINAYLRNELDAEGVLQTSCVSYVKHEVKVGFMGLSEKIDSSDSTIYRISADIKCTVSIENTTFDTLSVQEFYIAESVAKGIRYVVSEPQREGERLTKSYGKYLTDSSRYANCTVTVKTTESSESSGYAFVSGRVVKITQDATYDAEIYDEGRFAAQAPAYDASATAQDCEYYYYPDANNVQKSYRRIHKSAKSAWEPQSDDGDFYENRTQGLDEYLGSIFKVAFGLYVKNSNGFFMLLKDENGHEEYLFRTQISNDRIARFTEVEHGSKETRKETTFSDFGTTVTEAPNEADIVKIIDVAVISNVYSGVFEAKMKSVAEKIGAKVIFTRLTYNNVSSYLSTIAQGRGGADIIMISKSDAYTAIKSGVFADLTDLLADKEYADVMSNLHGGIKNDFVYDAQTDVWGSGATYAVPVSFTASAIGYNKTLLSAKRQNIDSAFAGDDSVPRNNDGSVKMPWEMDFAFENYTWEQYATMAAALSASGVYGCDMPDIELLTHAFGGSLLGADRNTVLQNLQPFKSAAAFQASLIDMGATARSVHDGRERFFLGGRLCFMSECEYANASLYEQSIGQGNWGMMPYPSNTAASWKGVSYGSYGFGLNAKSNQKAKAVELMMALLDDDVQTELIESGYTLPVLKSLNGVFVGNDDVDSVGYKTKQTLLAVVSGTNSFVSDRIYLPSRTWLNLIDAYANNILNASRGAAKGCLYSDSRYESLKSEVQAAYDACKRAAL